MLQSEVMLPVKGFSPSDALWRLLRLKGYDGNFVTFEDTYSVNNSTESMLRPLETEGIQARVASIDVSELPFLELPTLLQLRDSSWVLLNRQNKKGLLLNTPEGEQLISFGKLVPALSGQALDLSPSLPKDKSLWRSIKKILGHQKHIITQAAIATVMLQLLALAMPEITGVVMNRALPDGAGSTLTLVTIGVLFVALFHAWTGWVRERILLYLATRIEVSVERGFLEHLLKLPFPFLQKKTLGDMIQAFNGLATARELLVERSVGAFLDGALAVVYLIVMSFKLLTPTVVVVLVAFIMAIIAILVGRLQARLQALEVEAQAKEQGYLTELISGISTIKAAGVEYQGLTRWLQRFQKVLSFDLKKSRLGLWSEVGLGTLQQTMSVVLLIWGGSLCLSGKLQIGSLFGFMQLSTGFLGAVFGIVNAYLMFAVLRPQLRKAQEILATAPEIQPIHIIGNSHSLNGPVVMEDVWFRYSVDGPWILKGYNLCVKPGEKFTLRGISGSGKSTVLRLLAGLYTPEKGTITVDGVSPQVAQYKILYLPQFVQLYGGSIIENLRVLSCEAPLDRLIEAAQRTGLHDIVATLPMNYNTLLPHGGNNLSGGQRQQIVLTAAIASGRALLILDEAMANLDNVRSSLIQNIINASPWTVVMASHT